MDTSTSIAIETIRSTDRELQSQAIVAISIVFVQRRQYSGAASTLAHSREPEPFISHRYHILCHEEP